MSYAIRIIVIVLAIASLMIVGMEYNAFAHSGSKKINRAVDNAVNTLGTGTGMN